jgi:hypothetical protein
MMPCRSWLAASISCRILSEMMEATLEEEAPEVELDAGEVADFIDPNASACL